MTQAASKVVVVRLGRNPISTITSRNIHLSPALHHQMPKPDPKLVLKRTKNQVEFSYLKYLDLLKNALFRLLLSP